MNRLRFLSILILGSLLFHVSCGEKEKAKEINVQSVAISQPSAEMGIGETLLLKASISPSNASIHGMSWTSTKPQVASVSGMGLVTALSAGNTTITVMVGGKTASCNITVQGGIVSVSSISLNKTALEMVEGTTEILTVFVSPDNATDKTVVWSSSDMAVSTVDGEGKVTAVKEGTAIITAKAGDKTAQCTVTVVNSSCDAEAIDLGLSVKWASCNVGASKPEEYGDYFAWGETEPKDRYDWSTYVWCGGSEKTLTKYNTVSSYGTVDNETTLEVVDDVARSKWGDGWRMPTDEECTELRNNCTFSWTTQGGKNGYKVTSKINGNSIFLPAAGVWSETALFFDSSYGTYWSSSLDPESPNCAWYFDFYSYTVKRFNDCRYYGRSVRPVHGGDTVPVSGISLDMAQLTLEVGKSATITATVSPSNATNKTITWTSSNTSVATVSSNGIVTAKAEGNSTITAKAGDKTATCRITVVSSIIEVTSIVLDRTSVSLNVGETTTLIATVMPDNATEKTIEWKSSNEEIAVVDANGRVTGEHTGNAVVLASVGGKTAQCSISVVQAPSDNSVPIPEAIDLGLPSGVKWASFNLGASSPEENGDHYAWGEIKTKNTYTWWNYRWHKETYLTKYNDRDERTSLVAADDVAHVKLGGKWRMPTRWDWMDLWDNCTFTWTTRNGVEGQLITSKTNGESIFLPTAGYWNPDYYPGITGWYLSKTRGQNPEMAYGFRFTTTLNSVLQLIQCYRYYGYSVRPVYDE